LSVHHSSLNAFKWACRGGEVAGAKGLDPRGVISVERRHRIRASHIGRIGRIVEPQSQVIGVYGRGGRIRTGVRRVDDRRRSINGVS